MQNPSLKTKPRRLIQLVAILTAVSSLPAIYSLIRYLPSSRSSEPIATPVSSPAVRAISAKGRVEPRDEVIRLSAPSSFGEGAKIARLSVQEGDRVRSGQIVAVLDTNARLQATLVQARQDVEIARSKLARVEAGARKGEIEAQRAEISRLEVELKDEAAVDRTERNILQAQLAEESKVKKARINRSRSELAHAETELKRYQLLYGEGAIETSTYETKQLARDTAATSLAEAIADLGQTERTLQQRIARNRATYSQKVNTLQQQILQAKANLDRIVEVRPTDVRVARSELDRSIADVEKAKVDLETSYVRAPRSGQILKIYTRPGEVVGNDGILSLGQTDRMQVVAEVYETDIRRVRVGQKATVISDVLPEKLRGRVTRIGLQISQQDVFSTDPVADVDRRVIEVKIDLDPESSKRVVDLTNLQVEISIDP